MLEHRRSRRTTLTLEADVADYLEEKLANNKKLKEKNVINDLIRKGIRIEELREQPYFEIIGFKTKLVPGITHRQLEELLDEMFQPFERCLGYLLDMQYTHPHTPNRRYGRA